METVFYWGNYITGYELIRKHAFDFYDTQKGLRILTPDEYYSAPTVAELGEVIGKGSLENWIRLQYDIGKITFSHIVFELLTDPSELAKVWIYLKENKLI